MIRRFTYLHRLWLAAFFAFSGAISLSVWLAGVASAHASYVGSDPAAGAVLATAPTLVTVHFAEAVNPLGLKGVPSSLTVFHDPDLKNTYYSDQDATQVSPDKGTQYPASDAMTMTIPMKDDGPGIYEVYWYTVSADDSHEDSGVFFFAVGTTGSLQNIVVVHDTPPAPINNGIPVWLFIVVGLAALLVGGGVGAVARGRMASAGKAGGATVETSSSEDTAAKK